MGSAWEWRRLSLPSSCARWPPAESSCFRKSWQERPWLLFDGPTSSPMGKRREANGHPEPFRVRHWEVGNELWGRWQAHWTTATGYVDRYQQFSRAMLAADPTIRLQACGA